MVGGPLVQNGSAVGVGYRVCGANGVRQSTVVSALHFHVGGKSG